MARRKLIAGNWKMNAPFDPRGTIETIAEARSAIETNGPGIVICPPFTLIGSLAGHGVRIGGQNCSAAAMGAHTGEISAEMLAAVGASHVIVGHSERRGSAGERDSDVAAKAAAAYRAELTAIICVGETSEERKAGRTGAVIAAQIAGSVPKAATSVNTIIAYEPVWAIGSGTAASIEEIDAAHSAIRAALAARFGEKMAGLTRIIYGGSATPENASAILSRPDVDGVLVGGASLETGRFLEIVNAANAL